MCAGTRPECVHCGGANRLPILRCPNKIVTQTETDLIIGAMLVEHGVMPDQGGWQDQPATWTQAYQVAVREIAHWRAEHQRVAMRNHEQAKQRRR